MSKKLKGVNVYIHLDYELRKSSLVASTINASIDSDEKVAIREGFNSSSAGVERIICKARVRIGRRKPTVVANSSLHAPADSMTCSAFTSPCSVFAPTI